MDENNNKNPSQNCYNIFFNGEEQQNTCLSFDQGARGNDSFNPYMDKIHAHKKGNFYICGNKREEATYYNRFLFSIIVNPTKFQLFNSPNDLNV